MEKEKIAVIGSGISGISASLFLSQKYKIYLFEKNNYLGGHTRTKTIEENKKIHNIDTGFIVFNNDNYPDFVKFLEYLNIETENSNMSFSVSIKNPEFEYGSNNLKSIFVQKKNIFSINFWNLLIEIIIFYNKCKKIQSSKILHDYTLEDFLKKNNYSKNIRDFHIYPMLSSIWSCNKNEIQKFPLVLFINFFNNHKLFNLKKRHQWKYIKGGSFKYIESILNKKLFKYETNKNVKKLIRKKNKITIIFDNNEFFDVDKIIIATHANQALNLLDNPSNDEYNILSKFKYTKNIAYLHSDNKYMPKRKEVWSSWNFLGEKKDDHSFSLTYWMNLLQKLNTEKNYFVSINPKQTPKQFYNKILFEHPIFNLETLEAQKKINSIQGYNNTWYCGSYCGFGFHEDSIQSSAYVADLLNANLPWKRPKDFFNRLQFVK